jgi:two-component system LytT family response regulator
MLQDMNPVRALVVDDELMARKRIRRFLKSEPDILVVGECGNGREAIAAIQSLKPQLLFLDVQMPEVNGFEVLAGVPPEELPVVIFVTAFDEFALRAFEAQALDYLLKPFDQERFQKAVLRAKTFLQGSESFEFHQRLRHLVDALLARPKVYGRLPVKTGGRILFIGPEEIDWIEAVGNYVNLHVGQEAHLLRARMHEMEELLDPARFLRIHRSTIVNLQRVREYQTLYQGECVVILKNGKRLACSQQSSLTLQKRLREIPG